MKFAWDRLSHFSNLDSYLSVKFDLKCENWRIFKEWLNGIEKVFHVLRIHIIISHEFKSLIPWWDIINGAYQYRDELVVVIPLYALPALVDQTDPTGERYRSSRRHSPLQWLVVGRLWLLIAIVRLVFTVVCGRWNQKKIKIIKRSNNKKKRLLDSCFSTITKQKLRMDAFSLPPPPHIVYAS